MISYTKHEESEHILPDRCDILDKSLGIPQIIQIQYNHNPRGGDRTIGVIGSIRLFLDYIGSWSEPIRSYKIA